MEQIELDKIAARLQAARLNKGLSMNETARRAGIDPGTVSLLERGKIPNPGVETLLAIAATLSIPADTIFRMRVKPGDLPPFVPYIRIKYSTLPTQAVRELRDHLNALAERYGTGGPAPGDDEY